MSANWKDKILTIEEFWNNRPDMSVHTNEAVQSCIFQALGLLDSETNGLLGQVWQFNMLDPNFAPDSPLKRNEWELAQLKEAAIVQTQYMLNLGNDLSEGSSSFSIGNINSSFSRPTSRDIIAPGVRKLLQNGRVYVLQYFGNDRHCEKKCDNSFDPYSTKPITRAIGDKRYVEVEQGEAAAGNVAVVGTNGLVSFANPNDLNFSNFSATRIKDWLINEYVSIENVTNQLFRGKDLDGVHSGMTRGEIYTLNSLSFYPWNQYFNYKKDQIVTYLFTNKDKIFSKKYVALRDNVGKDPALNPDDWKEIGNAEIDLTGLSDIVYDRLVEKFQPQLDDFKVEIKDIQDAFRGEISQNLQNFYNSINNQLPTMVQDEVWKQLEQLPTTDMVLFRKGQVVLFSTRATFNELADKLQLVKNEDYREVPTSKYLRTDPYGSGGGSNLIAEANLPKINWEFGFNFNVERYGITPICNNYTGSTSIAFGSSGPNVHAENRLELTKSPIYTNLNESQYWPTGSLWRLSLNTLPQTAFLPEYANVYAVVFLKDITQKVLLNLDTRDYYNKTQLDSIINDLNQKYTNIEISTNQDRMDIQLNAIEISNVKYSLDWKEITDVVYGNTGETNYCDVNFNLPDGVKEFAFVGRFFITPEDTQKRAYVAINGVYKNDNTNLFVSCFLQYTGLVIAQIQGGLKNKRVRMFNQNGGPFIGTTENENFKVFYR